MVNLCFTIIFIIEAVIKITAYKKVYFQDGWNRFDFFIVVVSVIEIIMTLFIHIQALVVITLFRVFRVGRVLRLIKTAKGLRVIFATFILTIP
jgi:voltage-gated sodium channel type II alpha